jgi:tetratricopeptide (TPR) repeat protein
MLKVKYILALLLLVVFVTACANTGERGVREGRRSQKPAVENSSYLQSAIELGKAYYNTGNYAQALSTLLDLERQIPQNSDIKYYLGKTYFELGKFPESIDYYQKALAVTPGMTDIHNSLGVVYLVLKDYDKAREQFQICIDDLTYPQSDVSRLNMGMLEETLKKPDAAIPYYQYIISSNAKTAPSAYYRLAYIAYNKGEYRQSVDYLTLAVRLNSQYADAFFLLAESFEKLGFLNDAADNYGRYVVLDPNSSKGIEAQKRIRNIMKDYQ